MWSQHNPCPPPSAHLGVVHPLHDLPPKPSGSHMTSTPLYGEDTRVDVTEESARPLPGLDVPHPRRTQQRLEAGPQVQPSQGGECAFGHSYAAHSLHEEGG